MTQYFTTFAFTAFEIEMHLVIMKQFIAISFLKTIGIFQGLRSLPVILRLV